jgi:hypothetical protein
LRGAAEARERQRNDEYAQHGATVAEILFRALGLEWNTAERISKMRAVSGPVRLIFKRLEFHGPGKFELFEKTGVESTERKEGSLLRPPWLPEASIYRTWTYSKAFVAYTKTKPRSASQKRSRRQLADKQTRANRFQAMLNAEPELTRADMARRLRCSRAWITTVLGSARN